MVGKQHLSYIASSILLTYADKDVLLQRTIVGEVKSKQSKCYDIAFCKCMVIYFQRQPPPFLRAPYLSLVYMG